MALTGRSKRMLLEMLVGALLAALVLGGALYLICKITNG